MPFTTTNQRRIRLGEAPVSIDGVMLANGYRVTIGWEFPLMFYPVHKRMPDGTTQSLSEVDILAGERNPPIKLRQRHINDIYETCRTPEDVLAACLQIAEHGDILNPIAGQIQQAVAAATRERDEVLEILAKQVRELQERLDAQGGERTAATITEAATPAPRRRAPAPTTQPPAA